MPLSLFAMPGAVILTVDDAPQNLRLLRVVLSRSGAQVLEAGSVEAARKHLATTLPDIILLDVLMPGTDGFTLCQELKADLRLAHIPVIFLSGLTDAMDKVKAFRVGGADYISKPFEPIEVLARVSHHYRMLRMQQALQNEKMLLAKMNDDLITARQETADVFGAMADQMRGQLLNGKYLLDEVIGHGGFAVVYRAHQLSTQRNVAVKILRPTAHAEKKLHRFRQEAISASRVRHPNVTVVLDAAISSYDIFYLVMELLKGRPLIDYMKSQCPLPLERCIQIIVPVYQVLSTAHSVGVLHRDIKPANIFLHREGGREIVKVLDFGIAQLTDDARAQRGTATNGDVAGTLYYMSPEQMSGDSCDGRTDVYSAGVMLYEMLTGRLPLLDYHQPVIEASRPHLLKKPLPPSSLNPAVPPAIDAVVLAALSKESTQRPTAIEFLQELLGVSRTLLGESVVEKLLVPAKADLQSEAISA